MTSNQILDRVGQRSAEVSPAFDDVFSLGRLGKRAAMWSWKSAATSADGDEWGCMDSGIKEMGGLSSEEATMSRNENELRSLDTALD